MQKSTQGRKGCLSKWLRLKDVNPKGEKGKKVCKVKNKTLKSAKQ